MYKQLFLTFFKIGAFTLGGGYAMIPIIESEVVEKNEWINKEDFVDLIAVAQSCPERREPCAPPWVPCSPLS